MRRGRNDEEDEEEEEDKEDEGDEVEEDEEDDDKDEQSQVSMKYVHVGNQRYGDLTIENLIRRKTQHYSDQMRNHHL